MDALPTNRTWPPSCSHGTYQHKAITPRSRQLLMMGTWLSETCWAAIRREIKNTKSDIQLCFLIHTELRCMVNHKSYLVIPFMLRVSKFLIFHVFIYVHIHMVAGRDSSVGIGDSSRAGRSGVQTPPDRPWSPLNIGSTEYQDSTFGLKRSGSDFTPSSLPLSGGQGFEWVELHDYSASVTSIHVTGRPLPPLDTSLCNDDIHSKKWRQSSTTDLTWWWTFVFKSKHVALSLSNLLAPELFFLNFRTPCI